MRLWLNHIAVFAAVARAGSFTAAARHLRLPKSTVSAKVNELEAAFGIRLLRRTTRSVGLTEPGRELFAHAEALLGRHGEALQSMVAWQKSPRGRLVISAPNILGSLVVAPIVTQFLADHPEVEISLDLTDAVVDIKQSEVALALRVGAVSDPDLVVSQLGGIAFFLCASPSYIANRAPPSQPEDLGDFDCLPHRGAQVWNLSAGRRDASIEVHSRFRTDNLAALKEACLAGAGIALLPFYLCSRELQCGDLVRILSAWQSDPLPLHAVRRGHTKPTVAMRLFLDEAIPTLRRFIAPPNP